MADKYYGPERYKGIIANLPKSQRSKYKGKYIGPDKYKGIKPQKKNPKKPKYVVKTAKPGVSVKAQELIVTWDQSEEILNAYLAMAGTELFQYLNTITIDGGVSDVEIINVLSRRRAEYNPNRMIEIEEAYVVRMWINNGFLHIEMNPANYDEGILTFNVLKGLTPIARTIN